MARRRLRISRVRLAALAVVAAACLGLPLALALLFEGEKRGEPAYVIRDRVTGSAPAPPADLVELEPPSQDSLEAIAELRVAGDVDGLLQVVERARADRPPAPREPSPGSSTIDARGTLGRAPDQAQADDAGRTVRRQTARAQAATRRAMVAIASLCRVPGPKAEEALRKIATSGSAPSLERTTALAALWERGARDFVEDLGRDSDDAAVRSKVRALQKARP